MNEWNKKMAAITGFSKDEVIGQVRIPCMEYSRQAFSGALPIVRPNSTKMLVGEDLFLMGATKMLFHAFFLCPRYSEI